jgi:RHS repeat-associated protein
MNLAAKHGDPQLGIDIHMHMVPPSPSPVPLPTPHISIVFDVFDYLPFLGTTVTVCGMKSATAGTGGISIHIPPGFPFAPVLPDYDDELFMGSSTVMADGEPLSYTCLPVLGCQIAGMFSPPRLKKKKTPSASLLPTTVNLSIPTNVVVGGTPTISLTAMAFKAAFAGLGKFIKTKFAQKWIDKFREFRRAKFGNLPSGFLKCTILRAEPVNIVTGQVSVEQQDFELPGRIPLPWVRRYTSNNTRAGACGHGWETPADIRLEHDRETGMVIFHAPDGDTAIFPGLPFEQGPAGAVLEMWNGARLSDEGDSFCVQTKQDLVYHFPKASISTSAQGAGEYLLSRITDLCGNWLRFERRGTELTGITASSGQRLQIHTQDGKISSLALSVPDTGFVQTLVQYQYDDAGDLTAVRDELDNPYTFAYRGHHMTRHTDRNGQSFYYAYDTTCDTWQVTRAWGDNGLYDYTFQYQKQLNETRVTDSLGHVSIVKFDETGLPISEIDPLGGMTVFEYDDVGRTTAVVDPDGHRTEYQYDTHGNLLKLTRPDKNSIRTKYSPAGKPVRITAPNGATWQRQWDDRGLLVQSQSPLGAVDQYSYDAHGQLTEHINPRQACTRLEYDNFGNLVQLTNAQGRATLFKYDAPGNLLEQTDPLGHRTRFFYDRKGRLLQADLSDGSAIQCAYDAEDNLVRYVDENGAETRMAYCGLGEIKRRIQPDGHSIEYHYDTEERLTGLTNQRGETYLIKRDALGRTIEEIDYWGQSRYYTYSKAGRLQQSTDPLGRTIHYKTDPLGRIRQKVLPYPQQPGNSVTETFDYDENGNLTATANPTIKIQRRFDPEGRLIKETQGDFTVEYGYDQNNNCIQRKTSSGNTIGYTFDDLDQITAIQVNDQPPITIEHDARGQITHETMGESLSRHFGYDARGRLTHQRVFCSDERLFQTQNSYDPAGNLIECSDSRYGTDKYTYDPMGRIRAHIDPRSKITRFIQDPAGDFLQTRIVRQETGQSADPGATAAYSSDWSRQGRYGPTGYRFDRAGNLTQRNDHEGTTHFTWDANQRMIESQANGKTTTYGYDPLGRRSFKHNSDGKRTQFFWDGDTLVGEQDQAPVEVPGEDAPVKTEQARRREYVYYPLTFEPLALIDAFADSDKRGNRYHYYHNASNGSPTRLTDDAGNIAWAAQYNTMGAVHLLEVDTVENNLRMQGQYFDQETGLCYNRHRYFDPHICSFISQDPIGLMGGENVYAYGPNVWTWKDPFGLAHDMTGEVFRNGESLTGTNSFKSGGAVGNSYQDQLRSHTERKFLDQVEALVEPGDLLEMKGSLNPCRPGCQPAIRLFVQNNQVAATYYASETGLQHKWTPYKHGKLKGSVLQQVYKDGELVSSHRYWQKANGRWTRAKIKCNKS